MDYEAVIGLEVHAQLLTKSKIFCGCSTEFGAPPNTHVCPVCLGMPGVLPVLNRQVAEFAIRAGLALHCRIREKSLFARKNYFYPDLPKGYQISMFEAPLCEHGWLEIPADGKSKRVSIIRIHLEEDAGKLVHAGDFDSAVESFVDLNRAGVPLMEIVSGPDLRSPEEAAEYMRTLRNILVYLEVCDGNMEEGSLRCDANVSIRPRGEEKFGTRAELKNMNSFRHVEKALAFEIERQKRVLESGGKVVQETRLWNAEAGKTLGMRGKEESHDYRYFPDPDLVPLVVDREWVERVRKNLPELPEQKRARFVSEYGLPEYDAGVLTAEKALADYFEATVKAGVEPKPASNWIMAELLRELKDDEKDVRDCPVRPEQLAALFRLMKDGTISGKIAKVVFSDMYKTGRDPAAIVEEKGLKQVTDTAAIEQAIDEVIAKNPTQLEQYRSGKTKVFGFFVGQVMKATQGKANPELVNELLKKKLG
ncbi:MAG: aspartyl/glutamyl-tRNA amidotransferase subunit B [Deltaproteobacteria bacterium RBG_13_61_14]|nr:MAG: aspartyl/glutamyl-tRNA amidotransferase subunit B [Deltaproteobacteria bacterium RBG_13_61_14]